MKAKSSKSGGLRIALFLMMLIVATTMSAQRLWWILFLLR